MEMVGTEVPVYIGQLSLDLINATKIFIGKEPLKGNFLNIKPWKVFTIANTFNVTPFLVDHSTPEAFAFLIEADDKRVFYSGDFRATGRKHILYENLIKKPPGKIDLLLMEGTMIGRSNHLYPTEDSVEQAICKAIKPQENVTFVISSAQNIDRFISVFRACIKAQKCLVIDVYAAWVLDMVRKQSEKIPAIEWGLIKVYDDHRQLAKIKDKSFDGFRSGIEQQRVGSTVFQHPSDFVYFVRSPKEKLVDALRKHGVINIIYSQWEGYLKEEHKTHYTDYINALKSDSGISFLTMHTSGHATVPDLITFAKAINPKKIIPIHTNKPREFKNAFEKEGFSNITLWEDGKEYQV
jgi:ribonuclease J